jgi:hypothetical protein
MVSLRGASRKFRLTASVQVFGRRNDGLSTHSDGRKPAHHRKSVDLSIASSTLSNQQSIPASAVLVYSTDRDTIWRLLWIDEREQT